MTSYPLGVIRIHDRLRGWADGDFLVQRGVASTPNVSMPLISTFRRRSDGRPYACVTQATSAANPSICAFSRSSTSWETNMGKEQFLTPRPFIFVLNHCCISSQMKYEAGYGLSIGKIPFPPAHGFIGQPSRCSIRTHRSSPAYRPWSVPADTRRRSHLPWRLRSRFARYQEFF